MTDPVTTLIDDYSHHLRNAASEERFAQSASRLQQETFEMVTGTGHIVWSFTEEWWISPQHEARLVRVYSGGEGRYLD